MEIKTSRKYFIYSISIGILTSILMIIILFFPIGTIEDKNTHRKDLDSIEKFLRFQSEAESTINESINLLQGYLAYIKVNPEISEEERIRYLEQLLYKKTTLIRSVGIIKDTTVISVYPKEGNEKAIGVDFKTIPSQIAEILKVKETGEGVFIGPVDLIQGGSGFIARLPIIIKGEYWGQISMVLDGDKYLQHIDTMAKEVKLNIAIYEQKDFPEKPFYGDKGIISRNGMVLDIGGFGDRWKVAIEPLNDSKEGTNLIIILKVLAIIVSIIVGVFIYIISYARHELKYQAMNDKLTGLNNRYVLNDYYEIVEKKSRTNNKFMGIFLMDINKFKSINDNYGHKIGDFVLIEFARILQAINIRNKRVFRLGGDEFLIIVSEVDKEKDLEKIEQKIRTQSIFKFKHENIDIDVKSSVGMSVYPIDGEDLEKIMHTADVRMYEEKRARRGE